MKSVSDAQFRRRILAVFNSETLSRSRVFEWCARIRSGCQSVGDDDRDGVLHSVVTAVNMACVFCDSQGVILVDWIILQ